MLTLVKRTFLNAVSAAAVHVYKEIDMGLALGEALRILGVDLTIDIAPETAKIAYGEAYVSLDPDDTTPMLGDDDVLCVLRNRIQAGAGAIEFHQTTLREFWDFTNMKIVTCRNILFSCATSMSAGDAPAFNSSLAIFYERYKPTAQELNELILYRR